MPMTAIEVEGLRKTYGRAGRASTRVAGRRRPTIAVDALDLEVPEGTVYGLLGPNGSGKTTTLRCLLGLAAPTGGACRLLGADCQTQLHRVIRQVGAVTDTPGFHPGFSGRTNLALLGRLYGIGPTRVTEVLARVGLAERADDPVRGYSFGMRQRLGLAAALLKDPAVLIVDEPAGGLDPAGIVWVRDLLRELANEGRTVLVASHLLAELEQACDQVAILASGRVLAAGTLAAVLAAAGVAADTSTGAGTSAGTGTGLLVRLEAPGQDLAALREALREAGIPAMLAGDGDGGGDGDGDALQVPLTPAQDARGRHVLAAAGLAALRQAGIPATLTSDGDALQVPLPPAQAATVSRALAAAGLYPTELRPAKSTAPGSLEVAFLALTRTQHDQPPASEPSASEPSASEPSASEPSASEPPPCP